MVANLQLNVRFPTYIVVRILLFDPPKLARRSETLRRDWDGPKIYQKSKEKGRLS
jgi:hypothetical protein